MPPFSAPLRAAHWPVWAALLLTLLALCVRPATAQDAPIVEDWLADYPTLAAIDATLTPSRDLVGLAVRLRGATPPGPPPSVAPELRIGDIDTFWVSDDDGSFEVTARLSALGTHIALWVEQGVTIEGNRLQRLANTFDSDIYPFVRDLWGSEPSPGVDGDPRVHGLFARGLGRSTAAYYTRRHTIPVSIEPTSNAREMFFYNLDAYGTRFDVREVASTTAHEFQHMIRANQGDEDGWMDEGFSMVTELLLGNRSIGAVWAYQAQPSVQLNTWTEVGDRSADYGASLLWLAYAYQRFGEDGLRALSEAPARGMTGVNQALATLGFDGDADTLFADWTLANVLNDPTLDASAAWGYDELRGLLAVGGVQRNHPARLTATLPPYSMAVMRVPVNDEMRARGSVEVRAYAPPTTQLVNAAVDGQAFYALRGDDSNPRLQRTFDLRDASGPVTLDYRIWTELEVDWDYAYVLVSTDDGATFTPLATPYTTTDNPFGNAYGHGYTGVSEGWLDESVDLSAYVGQQIVVSFEVVHDDAVNGPGVLIDDVRLDAIGYMADFNDDDGGWQAEGWLRTDNILPLQVWVQAAQVVGGQLTHERWRMTPLDGGLATWTLRVADGAEQIVFVLAPFAPVTTERAQLTLEVK